MPQSDQCMTCKHYLGSGQCAAYLERIPQEILTGEVDHSKPYKGDNGITREPIDGEE